MKVVYRSGSCQQPPATRQKKAEGKKRKSPCTPYREKAKGKETQTGFLKETVFRAGARVMAALDADCDGDGSTEYYHACVKRAMNRLRDRPELRRTLRLVIKYGVRREDSIWAILESRRCPTWDASRKQYFAHLEKLSEIFCSQ